MLLMVVLSLLIAVLVTVLYISRRKFDYWEKRKVPHLKPTAIVGNYGEYLFFKKYIGNVVQDILKKFPNEPYVGAYYGTEPVLILQDPEFVKLVTTKDFYYFHGREVTNYNYKETVTQNLFFEAGDKWKVSRQNLTPLFSSAKMRNMFHLIEQCAVEFEKLIDAETKSRNKFEIRDLMSRFTMACICSCAFGVDIDTLGKKPESNPFLQIGKVIFEVSTSRGLLNVTRAIWPYIFYALGLKSSPPEVSSFFKNFLTKVFVGREYKATKRNDFVDLLLMLKEKEYLVGDCFSNKKLGIGKKIQLPVTDDFMIAQCFIFFAAGFETSATTLSYTLLELAKHPDALMKAQEEVDDFLRRHDNKLIYDCVTELPYTEACVDEALRLYPVLAVITREVMDEYTFPTGLKLDKGVRIHIPVYHLHHNAEYFPEPEQFRPERFLPEEKHKIVPHSYIPFGDGNRICIGMRFAKMQMMAGLVTLLKKYNVELAEGMPTVPEFNPRSFVTQVYNGIYLKLTPREGV
ncbi:unnamed protein product [Diatraea saccharalis]|uniref:unspecific monooxygenase n=1 Tax=Diatraea saccharalis TaxID=40085 RepID=A0A9N9R909_9NEOP|nr:unnamed protein product [Diatraea saccharalis]